MDKGFTLVCKECRAACHFIPGEGNLINIIINNETPNILPTMTIYCNKCGNKIDCGIFSVKELLKEKPDPPSDRLAREDTPPECNCKTWKYKPGGWCPVHLDTNTYW